MVGKPRSLSLTTATQNLESSLAQTVAVVMCWIYVISLHRGNDGLWYPGDSAVHAMNGVFWMDYLGHFTVRPTQFALSYYVRYPFINPINYPPFFYLLEAAAYRLFGISPFVAKGLVLCFALLGTFYLMAWLRRWISPAAGWGAILFLVQPAILQWSHAVMLNVPVTAIGIAALYHWRRWLEKASSKHLYLSVGWALAGLFTYSSSAVVLIVMAAWTLYSRRLRSLFERRVLISAAISAALIVPWMLVAGQRDSGHRNIAFFLGDYPSWRFSSWLYYAEHLVSMVRIPLLLFAVLAIVLTFKNRATREDLGFNVLWIAICYLWFSIFSVKEPRYILLMIAPILILAVQGVSEVIQTVGLLASRQFAVCSCVLLTLCAIGVAEARSISVPSVAGIAAIVQSVRSLAPSEWVFYDGVYEGDFTYYYRIADGGFSGGVVRGGKLLYATRIEPKFGLVENVSTASDVVNVFRTEVPCRYLLLERSTGLNITAERVLREAVSQPPFVFVQSFPVQTSYSSFVDLYEYTGERPAQGEFEYDFPVLGDNVHLKAAPIHH